MSLSPSKFIRQEDIGFVEFVGNHIEEDKMSLDVWLTLEGTYTLHTEDRIFIREDGQNKEITRAEWDEIYPDREPVVLPAEITEEIFSGNITHNLGKMANEAGIYKCLWRPDENNIGTAKQLIDPLQTGLDLLKSDPDRFCMFNPENGWGTYEGLVSFVSDYLDACKTYPDATIHVWR